ncbi:arabinosyltransferase domain-containing protein [Ammonicoccus fulvus]|uniref:Arabinosyltransferase domain-containing protein n=1 Tax=Ammonicoccus fulvus TaxID=3138240 RepID=A0ABZ3FRK8_9ACTN
MIDQPTPSAPTRRGWLVVLVLALLAGIGMLAYPLMPVTQHTATYRWDGTGPVALPLSPYRPERITVAADCRTEGVLLSTVRAVDEGMRAGAATITRRERVLALRLRGHQELIVLGDCAALEIDITGDRVTVSQDGLVTDEIPGDHRPAIDSLTSGPGVTGVSAVVVADTQFDSSPTTAKIVLGTVSAALLAAALALAAVVNRPRRALRGEHPRGRSARAWIDHVAVLAAMAFGVIAGGATDDDGFIAQILTTRETSGYIGNYVRWNNTPEAPFGWFYEIYSRWGAVSMEPVWLRLLPALLGVVAWFLLRHGLAPRLLRTLTGPARIALASGFTLLWLVFCNSLRPEIFFALGSGIVLWCVLDALHRCSVLPLLLAAPVAGLTVGAGPVGLMAIIPFVVALPRLWRWLRPTPLRGLAVATTWLAGLGSIVLLMFADQTLASVLSANSARTEFGPIYPFWEDYQRYWKLWWSFAARQWSVYLSVVALAVLAWHLRCRALPGVNRAVAFQVVAGALGLVLVMLLAPTKLPHHFGALLLLGPLAMAAGAHLLGVRPARARGALPATAGLLIGGSVAMVGLAMHNNNTWWKLSTLGLQLDKNPLAVGPIPVWPFVVLVGIGIGWWLVRGARSGRPTVRWALAYALALAVLSASQYANFAQAAVVRGPERYTMASAALAAMGGEPCLLERSLHYEPDPVAGVLPTPDSDPFTAPGPEGLRAWAAAETGPDRLETGWYALPDSVRRGEWPLVIAVSGLDDSHRVTVEYDTGRPRALTATRKTLATSAFSDIRLHPDRSLTRFRIIAESDGPPVAEEETGESVPFAVAQPRVPVTQPLLDLAERESVAVAWNLAFFAPCLDTPRQSHGRVEIADYILSDSQQPGNMSYHSRSGGPFAGVLGLTIPSRVPVYAAFDYTESEMSALDLVRLVPDFGRDLVAVEVGHRLRSGLDRVPAIP